MIPESLLLEGRSKLEYLCESDCVVRIEDYC